MTGRNFILADNVSEQDLAAILAKLAELYGDTGYTSGMELSRLTGPQPKYLVSFQNEPDMDRFSYFVNYIKYPEGFDVPGIRVTGYYMVPEEESSKHFSAGEWLQLYVSASDTEYDNVSVVNAKNESFLFDFGGRIRKLETAEQTFQLPEIDNEACQLIRVISPETAPPVSDFTGGTKKPWWKFW